ncbi:MAG: glycosyltransferase [Caldisericum sp.]|jgi:cellulose synthase/poly-beta-1,6-N-acetylglucosamine synthase-like glycosyltransferase|uniref:glycosyltransferase n=1 Tax=Caldisericum sp. TaxID=2499687 RepID=UPI003D11FC4A
MKIIFFIALFLILWHNLIYWVFLILVKQLFPCKIKSDKSIKELPFVSLIIAVHNEEKVIEKKISNALSLDYPKDKIEFIFASDNSTDESNEIISKYASLNKNIRLLKVEKRGGKVNAYNEAFKIANGEILAFSDANTMWDKNALKELVKVLESDDIACVCGHLIYTNTSESEVSYSEGLYWKLENMMKEAESKLYSLTALNGGIYAIKKKEYIVIHPLYSHDLCFPLLLGAQKKRTVFVKDAVAFERSGTTSEDEIKRKRRMFGRIYSFLFKNPSLFINPFKYNFLYFISVFSHRTNRYALPFLHLLLFISSVLLLHKGMIFEIVFYSHVLLIVFAIVKYLMKRKIKIFLFPYYYFLFLASMFLGFYDFIRGKIKPYWDVAETTRGG